MAQNVPAYGLYGESPADRFPDGLHIETISARSTVHAWRIRPHRHQDLHQLFLVDEGGGVAEISGERHRLEPSTLMLVPPLVVHGFRFHPGTAGWVASIPARTLRRAIGDDAEVLHTLGRPVVLRPDGEPVSARIRTFMEEAFAEFAAARRGRDHALAAHAGLLLLAFARAIGDPAAAAGRSDPAGMLVARYLERVEATFTMHLDLGVHAAALGVGIPHLTRVCRRLLGRSALAVLHDRVLLEAKRNLVYTSMTVSEVAFRLGFSDPAYFSRFFTARAGMPPSNFRSTVLLGPGLGEPDLSPGPKRAP